MPQDVQAGEVKQWAWECASAFRRVHENTLPSPVGCISRFAEQRLLCSAPSSFLALLYAGLQRNTRVCVIVERASFIDITA